MLVSTIKDAIFSLLNWLEKNDYSSYDHYDYLSTNLGIWSKRLFTWNKIIGIPNVALIYLLDTYLPNSRRIFAKKNRSAEAIPRIASGYFRLYQRTNDDTYLHRGCELLRWMMQNASNTKNGIGWGLHFDWQQREAFIPKGTPCVTITAYSTEAFLEAYGLTGELIYLETMLKTGDFVANDLSCRILNNKATLSYTPLDQNLVINANSYAAVILVNTLKIHNDPAKKDLVNKIVNYILEQQNFDGSWFYFDRGNVPKKYNFIDNFHTCFVLENLFLVWKWNKDDRLKKSVEKGFKFFKNNFINDDFSVRYYYYYPNPTGIKFDIRGCAEAIHCCALLSEIFPESLELANQIAKWTINHMLDPSGYFYFRIYRTHTHKMPYVRVGQAPMFNALTYLYQRLKERENG